MDSGWKNGELFGRDWSLYGTVNRALWVFGIMLPVFLLFSYPSERAARDEAKTMLAKNIAAENNRYCEKWRVPRATTEYAECVQDLIRIREETAQRIRAELAESF